MTVDYTRQVRTITAMEAASNDPLSVRVRELAWAVNNFKAYVGAPTVIPATCFPGLYSDDNTTEERLIGWLQPVHVPFGYAKLYWQMGGLMTGNMGHPLTNVVGAWRLNESLPTDNAADAGPYSLTGIKGANNPTVETGIIDGARGFGGVGSMTGYIFTVADTGVLQVQSHTIAGWIYVVDSDAGGWILGKENTSYQPSYLVTTVGGASNTQICYQCSFTDNPSTLRRVQMTGNLSVGWHHIGATFDGSEMCLYIDGSLADHSTSVGSGVIDYTGAASLGIGAQPSATINRWQGHLDDKHLYSMAQNSAWMAAQAQQGCTWRFYSARGPYLGPVAFDPSYLPSGYSVSSKLIQSTSEIFSAGNMDLMVRRNTNADVYLMLTAQNSVVDVRGIMTAICMTAQVS